jgi:peptidoglycan biosynthesis protein MviN/MurJ (putative lipid II flippase)
MVRCYNYLITSTIGVSQLETLLAPASISTKQTRNPYMLKTITLALGVAITTAISQPAMALTATSNATPSNQNPANNRYAQVVVSFPSAAIKIGSTTVILGQPDEHRHSRREERSERRERHGSREYHRDRQERQEREDRDSNDRH